MENLAQNWTALPVSFSTQ